MNDQFWNRIKKGDEESFRVLYEQYADTLYSYGMKITANDDIVSNAIQSLFIYLYEKRENLSVPNSIAAYLCVSLKRMILLELKKNAVLGDVLVDDISSSDCQFQLDINVEETMMNTEYQEELLGSLQDALDQLTKRQREIVYLKYFKEMTNSEIATVMGLNVQTIKNTTSQALARLRQVKTLAQSYLTTIVSCLIYLLS